MAILKATNGQKNVSSDEIIAALLEKVNKLQAQLDSKDKFDAGVTCKVSEKGALSIYGLGRFPVTLYVTQFDKLAKHWDKVIAFVDQHRNEFKTKD